MSCAAPPKISMVGSSAVLLDGAIGEFDDDVQRRVWAVANALRSVPTVREVVLGMNNLMVTFDPLEAVPESIEAALCDLWDRIEPSDIPRREVTIPVVYGGPRGEDLRDAAHHAGLSVDELIERHASATYSVAAVGGMPGFPYLSGLDPRLARPRRTSPRPLVPEGSVIIGGAQAGIMPRTGPSGWHILGHTDFTLFDAQRTPPATLVPGDVVRFTVARIET